jgi:hypothetical protein
VKTVVSQQDPGFKELVVEFVHVGHELGIGGAPSFSESFVALTMTMNRILFVLSG